MKKKVPARDKSPAVMKPFTSKDFVGLLLDKALSPSQEQILALMEKRPFSADVVWGIILASNRGKRR